MVHRAEPHGSILLYRGDLRGFPGPGAGARPPCDEEGDTFILLHTAFLRRELSAGPGIHTAAYN